MGCCQSQAQILDKTMEEKANEVQTTQVDIDKQSQIKIEKSIQNTSCKNIANNNIIIDYQTFQIKQSQKNADYEFSEETNAKHHQQILKQYNIGRTLGESIIGCTCVVTYQQTGQTRVMKVLPLKKSCEKEKIQQIKELNLLKQIDHPYIVKIFEHFQDEKNRFIIAEYCQGQQLLDGIKDLQPYNEKIASKYIKQILSAVVYCHILNLVHKNMKPENILFFTKQHNSILKLIDFQTEIESKQEIVSPPYYTPPETITENKYDEKSDVWSIGIIMYILLNGEPPFYGSSDQKVFEKIKSGNYQMIENISSEAKDLMQLMLQVDPLKRISAFEACAHPWIINNFVVEPLDVKIKEKLVQFITKNKFRNAVAVLLNNIPIFINDIEKLKLYFENKEGLLSKYDLIQGYSSMCGDEIKAKEIINDIYNEQKFNDDKKLEIKEFLQEAIKIQKNKMKKYFQESFKQIVDFNNNDQIKVEILENIVNCTLLNEQKVNQLIKQQTSNDGYV